MSPMSRCCRLWNGLTAPAALPADCLESRWLLLGREVHPPVRAHRGLLPVLDWSASLALAKSQAQSQGRLPPLLDNRPCLVGSCSGITSPARTPSPTDTAATSDRRPPSTP